MVAFSKVMLYHSGMTTPEPIAIRRAVELLGSQLALARALGVTPVTVNQWVRPSGANWLPSNSTARLIAIGSGVVMPEW
jgi:DNA-binding transcriptional regulator YdaS (Cro superfamily)